VSRATKAKEQGGKVASQKKDFLHRVGIKVSPTLMGPRMRKQAGIPRSKRKKALNSMTPTLTLKKNESANILGVS